MLLLKLILLLISIAIILFVKQNSGKKDNFISTIKSKSLPDLCAYILKSVKPFKVNIGNNFDSNTIEKAAYKKFRVGKKNLEVTVTSVQTHQQFMLFFMEGNNYLLVGMLDAKEYEFYTISGGEIITFAERNKLLDAFLTEMQIARS